MNSRCSAAFRLKSTVPFFLLRCCGVEGGEGCCMGDYRGSRRSFSRFSRRSCLDPRQGAGSTRVFPTSCSVKTADGGYSLELVPVDLLPRLSLLSDIPFYSHHKQIRQGETPLSWDDFVYSNNPRPTSLPPPPHLPKRRR